MALKAKGRDLPIQKSGVICGTAWFETAPPRCVGFALVEHTLLTSDVLLVYTLLLKFNSILVQSTVLSFLYSITTGETPDSKPKQVPPNHNKGS